MKSNYKSYLLRAMGMTNTPGKPSLVERNSFPGIDPDELEKGADEEEEEHNFSPDKSIKTAIDHLQAPNQGHYYTGVEKAKKQGMLKDVMGSPLLSPTAIATPVIGVAVRGSSTGGLPSGIDQTSGDISPSRLGGYEKVAVDPANSKLINKTPQNPEINSSNPINDNPKTGDGVTHPHQVQNNPGDAPQNVTGASTDSDDTLKLKSAMPKGIDVDVADENQQDKSSDGNGDPNKEKGFGRMNEANFTETFARHKELLKEKLKLKESTCKCGNPDCTCGCKSETTDECKSCGCGKPNTSHDMKENVGAEEPFNTKWKMDKEKAGMVRVSEAFERMRGLANLGERRVMSNGLWGDSSINEINYTKDSAGNPVIAVGAPGSDVRNAIEKGAKCKSCGKSFTPSYGEYNRCPDCLSSQHAAGEKATGVQEGQTTTDRLTQIKKGLEKKSKRGSLSDKEAKLFRQINEALNKRGA